MEKTAQLMIIPVVVEELEQLEEQHHQVILETEELEKQHLFSLELLILKEPVEVEEQMEMELLLELPQVVVELEQM